MSRDLSGKVTRELYLQYVWPTLAYGSPVWHGTLTEADALSLERLQASVARTLVSVPWDTPKSTLLEFLDWPSLRWRRELPTSLCYTSFSKSDLNPLQSVFFLSRLFDQLIRLLPTCRDLEYTT